MHTFIKVAAMAGMLLGSVAIAQAQSSQQGSTEAGTSYSQGGGGYGGAYARYGGHHYHHHYRR
jgi:hypothetical protein